jgi:hypothetical protein
MGTKYVSAEKERRFLGKSVSKFGPKFSVHVGYKIETCIATTEVVQNLEDQLANSLLGMT